MLLKFKTQKMIFISQKKINPKTTITMHTWNSYRINERSINNNREYPTCRVIICVEEYTNKTCSGYGSLYPNLESTRLFKFPQCNQKPDRDFKAARNILLKNMSNFYGLEVEFHVLIS